jgi:hypothetical protein
VNDKSDQENWNFLELLNIHGDSRRKNSASKNHATFLLCFYAHSCCDMIFVLKISWLIGQGHISTVVSKCKVVHGGPIASL